MKDVKEYSDELLQSNNCLLGWERVMETRAVFHFSWVYTFSAMLSSLRNWANHDRYRLRPSTPAQLCWSSSRLQPLQNNNLNKLAIIRPSNLHHNKNLWNCRGAPDETTCLTGFFRCPSALALICMKLFNICANKLSLSLSHSNPNCSGNRRDSGTESEDHLWHLQHKCQIQDYQNKVRFSAYRIFLLQQKSKLGCPKPSAQLCMYIPQTVVGHSWFTLYSSLWNVLLPWKITESVHSIIILIIKH